MGEKKEGLSRRNFIKGGALLGATVGLSTAIGNTAISESTANVAKALGVKQLDEIPLEIDNSKLQRFNPHNSIFIRGVFDPEYHQTIHDLPGLFGVCDNTRPGYTQLDYAFNTGAVSIINRFPNMYGYDNVRPFDEKYQFASKEAATKAIKRAAKYYGASLVGITPFDERWMFTEYPEFPFEPKSVIVMAVEMDYLGISTAPSTLTEGVVQAAYSKLMEMSFKMSNFIKGLGYDGCALGHFASLHVPFAVAAGIGELGRNGITITYEYGPRVRLIEVFTDFDFVNYDKPVSFGAWEFCHVCKKCASECPSESITLDDEPSWEVPTKSAIPGVKRFTLNAETCYEYWNTIGNGCAACITTCPYNKPDFWHHRLTTALTATPLKPFLNEMDDLFGYGDMYSEQSRIDFWNFEG